LVVRFFAKPEASASGFLLYYSLSTPKVLALPMLPIKWRFAAGNTVNKIVIINNPPAAEVHAAT
jgi:hypothetical protein